MFKDDYKLAASQITASDELKKLTLQKITAKKENKQINYIRYGLVCASFLFVIAVLPALNGIGGITGVNVNNSSSGNIGVVIPQTGVDDSVVYQDDGMAQLIREYHENTQKIEEDLKQKKEKLDDLIKKQQEPIADEKKQAVAKKKYEKEITKIKSEVESIEAQAAAIIPPNSIVFNKGSKPFALANRNGFSIEDGYKTELWTDKQVAEYMGVSPIPPYLPENLAKNYIPAKAPNQPIIFDPDGAVVRDTFTYYFYEEQQTRELDLTRRTLCVKISKGKLPLADELYNNDNLIASFINGCTLTIHHIKLPYDYNESKEPIAFADRFYTEFIHNGVGYNLTSDNLTEQEFIDILSSIIVKTGKKHDSVSSVSPVSPLSSNVSSDTLTSSDVSSDVSSAVSSETSISSDTSGSVSSANSSSH